MPILSTVGKVVFAAADLLLPSPSGPRLLIYHQVGARFGRQLEVTQGAFRKQLDWLQANREIVDLDYAIEHWSEKESDRLVVLTFDDGYRDTYTKVFPVLKERGVPFLVYVTTQPIDTARPMNPSYPADPLTWGQLGEMLESGIVTVGAHTHTHPDMRHLSEVEIRCELDRSDELISANLGILPRDFAYPYGYWSEKAHEAVRDRYRTATIGASPRPSARPTPHLLHRYPVQLSDGFRFFKSRVKGGLLLEEVIRRKIRGYTGP